MASDQLDQQLQKAEQFITTKDFFAARAILLPLAQANPDNAKIWRLLAKAQTNPETQRDMLKRALQLDPSDSEASLLLAMLDMPQSTIPMQPATQSSAGTYGQVSPGIMSSSPGGQIVTQTPRSQNRVLYILLGVGGTLVCLCLACVGIIGLGVNSVVGNPTFQAAFSTGFSVLNLPSQLPAKTIPQSALTAGQSVTGTAATLQYLAYTYEGTADQQITVTVTKTSGSKNTPNVLFGIYDTEGRLIKAITFTDAIQNNNQQALSVSLKADGTYTILVTGLSSSTNFTLTLDTP